MSGTVAIILLVSCSISFVCGYIFSVIINQRKGTHKADGIIRVNQSDPDKDVFTLEFESVANIPNSRYLILEVRNEDSHE